MQQTTDYGSSCGVRRYALDGAFFLFAMESQRETNFGSKHLGINGENFYLMPVAAAHHAELLMKLFITFKGMKGESK
jgi:hypothetical protein